MVVSELSVYKEINSFVLFMEKLIVNFKHDLKSTYGRMIRFCESELVKNVYLANIVEDFEKRKTYAEECLGYLETLKFNLRVMYVLKQLGKENVPQVEERIGKIAKQLWGWKEYFSGKSTERKTVGGEKDISFKSVILDNNLRRM